MWDIGSLDPPQYKEVRHSRLLQLDMERSNKDLYSMAWVGDGGTGWIMVGTMDGLLGWKISSERVKEEGLDSYQPKMVEFR